MALVAKPAKSYSRTNHFITACLLASLFGLIFALYIITRPQTNTTLKAWSDLKDCDYCPEMVVIPSGKFRFGSPESEPLRFDEQEGPAYFATVNGLAVSKSEILLETWQHCQLERACNANRQATQYDTIPNYPANNISWEEIKANFIPWLNSKTENIQYRLPTEEEWEYISRAGINTPFPNGFEISSQEANFRGTISYVGSTPSEYLGRPAATKTFMPNSFGLYETQGNLLEWTENCWTEKHVNLDSGLESDCELRALRGGSWLDEPNSLRFAYRRGYDKSTKAHNIGFRLVRDLTENIDFQPFPVTIVIKKNLPIFKEGQGRKWVSPNYSSLQYLTAIETINLLSRVECSPETITQNVLAFSCSDQARLNQVLGRPEL